MSPEDPGKKVDHGRTDRIGQQKDFGQQHGPYQRLSAEDLGTTCYYYGIMVNYDELKHFSGLTLQVDDL